MDKTIRCLKCNGIGLCKRSKKFVCSSCKNINNKICYLCENVNRGLYIECDKCYGEGSIITFSNK